MSAVTQPMVEMSALDAELEAQGVTQRELARRLLRLAGVTNPTDAQVKNKAREINRWQAGKGMSARNAKLVAQALNVPASRFNGSRRKPPADVSQRLDRVEAKLDVLLRALSIDSESAPGQPVRAPEHDPAHLLLELGAAVAENTGTLGTVERWTQTAERRLKALEKLLAAGPPVRARARAK